MVWPSGGLMFRRGFTLLEVLIELPASPVPPEPAPEEPDR